MPARWSVDCCGGVSARVGGRCWIVCGRVIGSRVAPLGAASAVVGVVPFRYPLPADGVGGCIDLGMVSLIG